ncbi:MAG TPA: glycosyltransferase family 39 protein [Candidatus Eisenbacteria bacterium]|nr:glycosyltransferase family 39 protein [Candidatus Eisenbacteria bacterium]
MTEQPFSALLFRTVLAGALLGALATAYFLAGVAGHVRSPVVTYSVAIALVGSTGFFLYWLFFLAPRETGRVGRAIWLVVLLVMFAETVLGLLPPTARDELTHHLAIPKLYVEAGRIIEVPIAPYSYYPMLLDMLFTPWVYWNLDFVPKLVHSLFGALTGLLLYAYLSRRLNPVYGQLGFFFFVSTPAVLRLSHWAYVDLGVTFYVTAALLCLLVWRETEQSGWLVLCGLSAGFAAATKPNGLVAALVLFLILLFVLASRIRSELKKCVSCLALFTGLAVLPLVPWLVKNYAQTGNPLFPHGGWLFVSDVATQVGAALSYADLGVLGKRRWLYGESWLEIAALPLRIFFSGRDDVPQYFDGALTPVLVLLLPWAFKGKWGGEKRIWLVFAVLYFAYAVFLVDLRIRYILPIVPPLVVLLVWGVFNVYLRIRRPAYLVAGLVFFGVVHLGYLYAYFRAGQPIAYLSGRESRETYLSRTLPDYPAFRFLNRETPPDAKIYLLFAGRRAYYCNRSYFHDGGELPGFLMVAIRSAREPSDIARRLRENQLSHLLVREDLLIRFLADNLTPAERALWAAFASNHLELLFRDRGYSVLQVHG